MKKILFAFTVLALLSACTKEEPLTGGVTPEQDAATKLSVTTLSDVLNGVAYIQLSSSAANDISLDEPASLLSLSGTSATLSATLSQIGTYKIERMFAPDSRFPKRMKASGLDRWFIVNFDEKVPVEQALSALSAEKMVVEAEPAYTMAIPEVKTGFAFTPAPRPTDVEYPFNDPELSRQWHYKNYGLTPRSVADADCNLFEAWKTETGKSNVIVCVVDGGIDITHEDLVDNLWINPGEIPGDGKDNDGNGYIDDIYGWNFSKGTNDIQPDYNSHGTHVAGTVAAKNGNGIGVCGVAGGDGHAGTGVRLMSAQWLQEEGSSGSTASAIVYGANNGAVISQNSWGYTLRSNTVVLPSSMKSAIDYFIKYAGCDDNGNQLPDSPMKGGVVIFAAGNDDKDYVSYPGAYEPVVAVSAMAPDWKKSWYTNRGDWVDIMAPGGDDNYTSGMVYSTMAPSVAKYGGVKYGFMQGTSMACPHVSGIAALVVSHFGGQGFTADECKARIQGALRPKNIYEQNPAYVGRLGIGYIDAARALDINQNKKPEDVGEITIDASFTNANLSWTAVKDEDDGTAYIYRLYFHTSPVTASNLSEARLFKVGGGGVVGTTVNQKITGLKDNTPYYIGIIAVDRWGLESAMVNKEFTTLKNNAPVAENIPTGLRISPYTPAKFDIPLSDPDGHSFSYKIGGEKRGVSYNYKNNTLSFNIVAVAPAGDYNITLTVTDELEASQTFEIPFTVFNYAAPALSGEAIGDMIIGMNEKAKSIDVAQYFKASNTLTYSATATNTSIATCSVNGSTVSITPVKAGNTQITVEAKDDMGKSTSSAFLVRVVENSSGLVYAMYPIPVRSDLTLVINPSVEKVKITIRTVMGEKILEQTQTVPSTHTIKLNLGKKVLQPGTYTLTLDAGSAGKFTKAFVKQ